MQGYQKKYVTPYMHCMVYHVPTMLTKYGNLRQFSGQGTYTYTLLILCTYVTIGTLCRSGEKQ